MDTPQNRYLKSPKGKAYRKLYNQTPKRQAYMRRFRGQPEPTRPMPATCECCGGTPTGQGRLHLDHDHATGAFRGWLCSKCNKGLGLFGDTLVGVLRAAGYLRGIV